MLLRSVPRGKHLDIGEEPCGVWGHHYSQAAGDYFVCPFCHHPDPAVPFPSVSHNPLCFSATSLPRGDFPREPRFAGFWFPCSLSRSAPEKSEAILGLQKRTQAKWGCGLGHGRVGAGLSRRLEPTTALHLSPNSTPNTPQLPTSPRLSPHLLGLIISHN